MTGKEKLIEWIQKTDNKEIVEMFDLAQCLECPGYFGLEENKKEECNDRPSCTECWQKALEKEY